LAGLQVEMALEKVEHNLDRVIRKEVSTQT